MKRKLTIIQCPSSIVAKPSTLFGLWKHEMMRVFADKFTTVEDKQWFDEELNLALATPVKEKVKGEKKSKEEKVNEWLSFAGLTPLQGVDVKELPQFFADFLRFNNKDESGEEISVVDMRMVPKIYEPIASWNVLREMCENYMEMYNEKFVLRVRGISFPVTLLITL